MLDDHARRLGERVDQIPCGIGVVDIEIAQILATPLTGFVPPATSTSKPIASTLLVRVLPVTEILHFVGHEGQGRRQRLVVGREPLGDPPVVVGGHRKRDSCQVASGRVTQGTGLFDLVGDSSVVVGSDHHTDVRVILGCTAHHGWTTDVDQFDRGRLGERIQVHDDERDRIDSQTSQVVAVRRLGQVGEDRRVDPRMQRDHTMTKDRATAGDVGDVGDLHTGFGQSRGRASARDDRPTA